VDMNYCMHCGARLALRDHETEGRPIPWCEHCQDWRFPVFNAAVSMVVLDESRQHVLLIQQYGRPFYILPAGYINLGEGAEDAVRRELQEELGLEVRQMTFNRSRYFPPSNTLLFNFVVTVTGKATPNWEVDAWRWFTREEARQNIKPASFAEAFLLRGLDLITGENP